MFTTLELTQVLNGGLEDDIYISNSWMILLPTTVALLIEAPNMKASVRGKASILKNIHMYTLNNVYKRLGMEADRNFRRR